MIVPALVVQCFIKTDTLKALCDSLLKCVGREKFALIFWCDNAAGSAQESKYAPLNAEVIGQLDAFRAAYGSEFASCEVLRNAVNLGTCRTCQAALDHALAQHDFAIFAEDDTVFSRDALEWVLAVRRTEAFSREKVWAIAGESIFFDSRTEPVTTDFVSKARVFAELRELQNKFIELSFIPSTCFATSSEKWREFSQTRGQPLGDEDVCARCAAEEKICLFPVVPRVRDTGMLHDLGYSVAIHTAAGVREVKNTYLMAEDVLMDGMPSPPMLMIEGAGEIYQRSVKLTGFDDVVPVASSDKPPVASPHGGPPATQSRAVTPVDPAATPPGRPIMLEKTLALIADVPPGTFVPEERKVYDEDEIRDLGSLLCRLMYAPSQIRKKIETYGASIVPANFYSEVPTQVEIATIFAQSDPGRYNLIFRDSNFLIEILKELTLYSEEFDPPIESSAPDQYGWKNGDFSYSDAMASYAMLRRVKPKTMIEIGCGWSTLVADQAVQRNGFGRILCVEPHPAAMLESIKSVETIVRTGVQSVDLDFFNNNLQDGDVISIDSTHAVKAGSDCIRLYLEILPRLTKNVTIHVHDIKLPFMLSEEALRDKQIYWTEQYLLYAYLLENPRVRTLYGSAYHQNANRDLLKAFMHGRYGEGGGSFWFEQSANPTLSLATNSI